MNFYWKSIKKQIRIEGKAKKITIKQADDYFFSRENKSKISAWVSNQSSALTNRKELEEKFEKYEKKFYKKIIPRPSFWSGYKVFPLLFEFWQEMPFRLHDRIEYKRKGVDWIFRKLYS